MVSPGHQGSDSSDVAHDRHHAEKWVVGWVRRAYGTEQPECVECECGGIQPARRLKQEIRTTANAISINILSAVEDAVMNVVVGTVVA